MRVQEHIAEGSQKAGDDFFKYAKAVPADKLNWSPLENGRTVLSQCREVAISPTWGTHGIGPKPFEEAINFEEDHQLMQSWSSVEECERQFNERMQEFAQALLALTDEDLKKTKWLPYGGGKDTTFAELADYVRWNGSYHLGQVAYIQTLYGDKEMH